MISNNDTCTRKTSLNKLTLKELPNRISRIIRLWYLFCSKRVNASLHFLPILLENKFFIVLRFLSFLPVSFLVKRNYLKSTEKSRRIFLPRLTKLCHSIHELHHYFIVIYFTLSIQAIILWRTLNCGQNFGILEWEAIFY